MKMKIGDIWKEVMKELEELERYINSHITDSYSLRWKVKIKDDDITITVDIPGVEKEAINLDVDDEYITIQAESDNRNYYIEIPVKRYNIIIDSIKAKYDNGVLTITGKIKRKFRRIEIE